MAALLGLAACSAERVSNFPSYKLKVIQGNELDARAVASLQPGMSRDQVQLLLGTPLLRDPFHNDRWDYTYNTSRNGIVSEQRTLTLYFNNDQLVRAEGDAIQYAIQQLEAEQAAAAQQQAEQQQQPMVPQPQQAVPQEQQAVPQPQQP
nr:outer membrane protein assembly factor BamE [Neisseria montereyensis]